jgi:hypothetical protein
MISHGAQAAGSSSSLQSVAQQVAFPLRFKGLTKVIDAAKEFFYTKHGASQG